MTRDTYSPRPVQATGGNEANLTLLVKAAATTPSQPGKPPKKPRSAAYQSHPAGCSRGPGRDCPGPLTSHAGLLAAALFAAA